MADRVKKVTLDGKFVSEVIDLKFNVATFVEDEGQHSGRTCACTVELVREADLHTTSHLFNLATHTPGAWKRHDFPVEIEIGDDKGNTIYTITLNDAFAYYWKLDNPDDRRTPITETIKIASGDAKLTAGDTPVEFKLERFGAAKR